MKVSFTILILLALLSTGFAQTTVSFPDTTVEGNSDTVYVPLSVANFRLVGAISLDITFDTSQISFSGIVNELTQGSFDYSNGSDGHIKISWYNLSPANITNGTVFNLVFTKIKGNTTLQFQTSDCEITDTSAINDLPVTYNKGYIKYTSLPVTLSGKIWFDTNNNGILDPGEPGVPWINVNLFSENGNWLKWGMTDSSGSFTFDSLQPGSYYVYYSLSGYKAYKFTTMHIGNNPALYSHAKILNDSTAYSDVITLYSSESYTTLDAGVIDTSTIPPTLTGIEDAKNNIPKNFSLSQNYPNPFNPSTKIEFSIPSTQKIELNIYNILGQKIATLFDGEIAPGIHTVTFDASRLASGVYIYQLRGENVDIVKKMILTK